MRIAGALLLALTLPMVGTACTGGTEPVKASPSSAVNSPAARLPSPTEPFVVGRNVLHLVDNARTDPWQPELPRELMVSMYYPAQRGSSGEHAPYATDGEISLLIGGTGLTGVPAHALSRAGTNAVMNAEPAEGSHPLVVLSPGFTAPRYTLTALAEELAARGYVVAAVDHSGESFGTEFPGRMSTCAACEKTMAPGAFTAVAETRAHDTAFLLDRLTGADPVWPYGRLIDATRIGTAGHSIGGASAAAAMALDPRVRAGVNMDGSFHGVVPAGGLGDRPFLMLAADDQGSPTGSDPSWTEAWPRLHGWKRWLTLTGSDHESFIDTGSLAAQLGAPIETALSSARALDLTRTYVAAFFDQHLRGIAHPLLDRPDPAYPEIRFNTP
ncbi:alpha/beta hydrolase [Nocardia sp. NPDC006630]|uniref:alpha/beta hydrolase family protein n=1 Tax=Nocardia sp. NPDC006630 TaxID=3157181 RepID=UPI0033B48D14